VFEVILAAVLLQELGEVDSWLASETNVRLVQYWYPAAVACLNTSSHVNCPILRRYRRVIPVAE
jgi:hypothetical protein